MLSEHQKQGYCAMCADDASRYNHCSWCGETLPSPVALSNHMDEGCLDAMMEAMTS